MPEILCVECQRPIPLEESLEASIPYAPAGTNLMAWLDDPWRERFLLSFCAPCLESKLRNKPLARRESHATILAP